MRLPSARHPGGARLAGPAAVAVLVLLALLARDGGRPHLARPAAVALLRPPPARRGGRPRLAGPAAVAVLALLALLVLPACAPGAAPAGPATVARVVDGDTVEVRVAGRVEPVRLIGIDTPETSDPRRPVECFGAEATARTSALLPEGTEVVLERDVEARDRYDRLLAYVYRKEDGLFVNLALVEEGYAVSATYPPNVAHRDELGAAAAAAREAGRGLWERCGGPVVPAA